MKNQKSVITFWCLGSVIVILAVILNYSLPQIVEGWYKQEQFDLLNSLSGSTRAQQTFDYYLGKIEDRLVGPMTNVVGFVFLLCFIFLYQAHITTKRFFLLIFVFLILTKFNVLFYPPYGDAIGGPFAEAIWLAKHNFNYSELYHQAGYDQGGPKVYFFSLYPTSLAILIKLLPNTQMFLVAAHLIVFAMAALVLTLVKRIVETRFDKTTGVLSAIFILALPLFQSQTEAINMEMPCLFFSMIAIYFLTVKHIGRASIFAFLAMLYKGHGIIICGTVFIVSLLLVLFDEDCKGRWKNVVYASLAVMGALLKVFSKFLLKDQHAAAGLIKPLAGWPSLKIMYITYMFIAVVIVFWTMTSIHKRKLIKENYIPLVIFITAGMWYALFLNFQAVSPRYKLELAPFLVMCIIFAVLEVKRLKGLSTYVLSAAIIVASAASYGLFHKPLVANYHVLLERSLEYRNEHKLNMRLVEKLKNQYANYTIGAPFLTAQTLAMPELGYVDEPLSVMVYGMPLTYGNIKNFDGLDKNVIISTIWVGVAAQFGKKGNFSYPVGQQDEVIETMELGENKLVLFRGGFSIFKRYLMIERMKAQQKQLRTL